MTTESPYKERRRYQRVSLPEDLESLFVEVAGHGPCQIFDMSYNGAALSQPSDNPVEDIEKEIKLLLKVQGQSVEIGARPVRLTADRMALAFSEIEAPARLLIDQLVHDPMVGLNMVLIEKKHYSVHSDFSHWFHGPKETNLYFWFEKGQLEKAELDLGTALVFYSAEGFLFENKSQGEGLLNNGQMARKALAILSQMDASIEPIQIFKSLLDKHVQG